MENLEEFGYFLTAVKAVWSVPSYWKKISQHRCSMEEDCVFASIRRLNLSEDRKSAWMRIRSEVKLWKYSAVALNAADALGVVLKNLSFQARLEGIPGIEEIAELRVVETIKCGCECKVDIEWNSDCYLFPVYLPEELGMGVGLSDAISSQSRRLVNLCPRSTSCTQKNSSRAIKYLRVPEVQFIELIWPVMNKHAVRKFLERLEINFINPLIGGCIFICTGIIFANESEANYVHFINNKWIFNNEVIANTREELGNRFSDGEIPSVLIYERKGVELSEVITWICDCNNNNCMEYCDTCLKLAPGLTGWLCKCKTMCQDIETRCSSCQNPRFLLNYWNCLSCRDFNDLTNKFCYKCKLPRHQQVSPFPSTIIPQSSQSWNCIFCDEPNLLSIHQCKKCSNLKSAKKCLMCKAPTQEIFCGKHMICLSCSKYSTKLYCLVCFHTSPTCKCAERPGYLCESCVKSFWKCGRCFSNNTTATCFGCPEMYTRSCWLCNRILDTSEKAYCKKCSLEIEVRCEYCLACEYLCRDCEVVLHRSGED